MNSVVDIRRPCRKSSIMSTPVFNIRVRYFSFATPRLSVFNLIIFGYQAVTLSQVLETSDGSIDDDYSITAMSLLNTLETIVSVMEEQPQIISQVRPIVLQVAVHILKEGVMGKTIRFSGRISVTLDISIRCDLIICAVLF